MDLLGGTLVANVQRIGRAFETGGASEFERLRNKWLSGALPVLLKDKKTAHSVAASGRTASGRVRAKTGSTIVGSMIGAASRAIRRQGDGYRDGSTTLHLSLQYAGTKPGRTVRTFRRKRRARRAAARKLARQLMERDN